MGGGFVSLHVVDAMAAHEELVARGTNVTVPPAPSDYALVDFIAEDLDGNQLLWGSDTPGDG